MAEALSAGGDFWKADEPDHRVRGRFAAELGEKPEVTLTDNLVPDPRVSVRHDPSRNVTTISHSAEAKRSVASFRAITVHGQLDSGEAVTIIGSQNYGGSGSRPRYRGTAAVVGAQVPNDQLYSSVRFRLDNPYWLAHLDDGDSSTVDDDASTLTVEASDDGNWLVYKSSTPITLRQMEIRVVSGCLALLQLAIYPDPDEGRVARETQVRINSASPWLQVYGAAFCAEPAGPVHEPLLLRNELTVERFSKWVALHSRLDGLSWVVARPSSGSVQMSVLAFAPLIEGFHRRLPGYEQAKFPGVAKCALKRVLQAARKAAAAQAAVEGLDPSRVEQAADFYRDVSFLQRADAIVAEVTSVIPEVAEFTPGLPRRITKARNALAHHLTKDDDIPIETRALNWLVVANTTAWLLRILLLLRVGVEPEVLRERVLQFGRFRFFLANTEQHVRELGWELPPSE
ncbi:HEPN domain-containing protein [Mycobacterium sp. 852002-40037_SCH5390672]|uniref:HEPN domain-containing protein n=1 Tax=Mycobacterium sp. 852002-40037_SCH5390672 TaxID=1834089 RepID=UPI000805B991|nr:HEPN domain-containing protein [Mycobacterium sp. 852002-40037_SCH5390672]OBB90715.1 hypothetical protein A5782_16520 [Mycobacterium sp. 852002-40037_SCH5390672]